MRPGPEPRDGLTRRVRESLHQYRKIKALQGQLNSATSKLEQSLRILNPPERSAYDRNIKAIG